MNKFSQLVELKRRIISLGKSDPDECARVISDCIVATGGELTLLQVSFDLKRQELEDSINEMSTMLRNNT